MMIGLTGEWVVWGIVALYGAVVGSFLNVCIHRIPLLKSIVSPPSHCPRCDQAIRWFDNIPLFSYLLLGGRCRHCKVGISWIYPLVELLSALMAVGVVVRFGLTWEAFFLVLLGFAFIVLTMIDFEHYILPDVITLPGIAFGLFLSAWLGKPFPGLQDAFIGASVGGLGLWAFAFTFEKITGRQGMGLGDVKLLALIGAWMGWQSLPFTLFVSALVGTLVGGSWILIKGRNRQLPIPFGPYLAVAAWLYLFYGKMAYAWYFGIALKPAGGALLRPGVVVLQPLTGG